MKHHARIAAAYVAFLAMLMHGLVPAGWMPSGTGHAPVTICTVDGPVHLVLDQSGAGKNRTNLRMIRTIATIAHLPPGSHVAAPTTAAVAIAAPKAAELTSATDPGTFRSARISYLLQPQRAPPLRV
jgi:hypothetical protein